MDIIELLKKDEGKTFELKQDISSSTRIIKAIIAFANTAGGILLIGVEDKTKFIVGVDEPLDCEESIASCLYDNIEPKIVPDIEILPWRNTYLLKIEIFPSTARPHYFKKHGLHKGTFVRVGSTNRMADPTMIQELQRYQRLITFDEELNSALSPEDIDFAAASECFSELRKLKPSDLHALSILGKQNSKEVPTNGGIILFGKKRLEQFPDARLQAGRFGGLNKDKITDTMEVTSYPAIAVKDAIDFVKKNAQMRLEISGTKHTKKWSILLIAIREAIINAIVHADYAQRGSPIRVALFDDRIEIENPGLLLFGLTIEDLYEHISKIRNRVIAKTFHKLGLIEQWGSGIGRIISECERSGLPCPKFEELATHFRVTIYLLATEKPKLSDIEKKIIRFLSKVSSEGATTSDVANAISRSARSTRTQLMSLISAGLVIEIASNSNDPNRRYYIK
jgi:ATP-dependent DNA helicase RecG